MSQSRATLPIHVSAPDQTIPIACSQAVQLANLADEWPPHLLQQARQQSAPQIPDIGDLTKLSDAELWERVEQEHANIRRVEKEIAERGVYLTATRYRQGMLLLELKRRSEHGDFEAKCKEKKIKSQRASENMCIADYFPNEVEAGKVPVVKALVLARRGHPGDKHGGDDTQRGKGENTETPPLLCQWIYERLDEAGIHPETILDPCAGRGNLTKPFPESQVIAYEINEKKDFFEVTQVHCDLVLCNPPWLQAERWLPRIVEVVGRDTPIVYICPTMYMIGYRNAPFRQYLESPAAPPLDHFTPLPIDTFPGALGQGAIYWFNLPDIHNEAMVPSRYLIRAKKPMHESVTVHPRP